MVVIMNRLRDLREDNDLTQEFIAKIICCSQTTYSRYESEDISIPIDSLKKLAIFYETSVDYLVCLTDVKIMYRRSSIDKMK